MIVGNGMIANRFAATFRQSDEVLIFASGVSNSTLRDSDAFLREEQLLMSCLQQNPGKKFIYFSSCSLFDPSLEYSPYVLHKRKMEALIGSIAQSYLLCRTTNIIGYTSNPHTLVSYLCRSILNGMEVEVWQDAYRNLLDIDHLFMVVQRLISSGKKCITINVFNPVWYSVPDIVGTLEKVLDKKAKCTYVSRGSVFKIPEGEAIIRIFAEAGVVFDENYLSKVLYKYYRI